ncbi:phage tail sheath subtilisin-like domain-containing protein [Morganella morganii]|uniref:phage tail sheath subtilisin-like domain-containing protein n=1 Tax=Morganella morganii TaxID=582 RepID=UPI0007DB8B89|nr:phage tail sheath subtilisin-like domain-containing protein [Morganella morganii]HDS7362046.1 phage tail sheath subtilisin-like domain-containing protein [Morganella morganii subsp. morganii]OAS00516.1 phage tail protein [Morganella morganii]UEH02308.1 phage tail sheath subtilisin-like domain-containing protein [Morganella morganii]WNJ21743.1 phage tail sheath subtilisin-like domain-containing protein [Morganella morganii]HEO9694625.1 phage tail sheath subtilisin-like domain-containing prot
MTYHHGVEVKETTKLTTLIRDINTSVIGVVCTGDDADAEQFPLDTPVLVTRIRSVLGKAGKTGTLYKTLKAISDQCSPKVIVIRVADAANIQPKEGEAAKTQDQLVIGGNGADGRYTGLYALLTAKAKTDEQPRILIAPELDTKPVALQMAIFAEKLRAFAYVSANGCTTIAEAKEYRSDFSQREVMVLYPDWIGYNSEAGKNEVIPAPAVAAGLRARIDDEQGWHKSLSNVPVNGVLGMSADVYWSLQDKDTDANDLNEKGITTLIKNMGFRFWGNRTCDEEIYFFEVYTRTAQILADMIAEAHFSYVDKPLTPSLIKDIIDGIQKKGDQLVTQGRLLGFRCWYDPADNPSTQLRDGHAIIKYKYTPVPPLERLGLEQTFTDEYFAVFNQLGSGA